MSIKIYFENIGEGNLQVKLKLEEQILVFIASYIPYNSFLELVDSLIAVLTQKKIDTTVRWNTEPVEYEFQFSGFINNLSFAVKKYPDSRRKTDAEKLVFSMTGSELEIVLPFWRALRQFQGHPSNFCKWKHSFPSGQMSRLNELFENYSVEPKPFDRHE
jgi:hypothetical protein